MTATLSLCQTWEMALMSIPCHRVSLYALSNTISFAMFHYWSPRPLMEGWLLLAATMVARGCIILAWGWWLVYFSMEMVSLFPKKFWFDSSYILAGTLVQAVDVCYSLAVSPGAERWLLKAHSHRNFCTLVMATSDSDDIKIKVWTPRAICLIWYTTHLLLISPFQRPTHNFPHSSIWDFWNIFLSPSSPCIWTINSSTFEGFDMFPWNILFSCKSAIYIYKFQ